MFETLCFDICAFGILLLLFFALIFRKHINDIVGIVLIHLIGLAIVASFSNILLNYYNAFPGFRNLKYFLAGCHHISRAMACCLFTVYIIKTVGILHRADKNAIFSRLIPLIITFFAAITARSNNYFYIIDNMGHFLRGQNYRLFYFCSGLYFAFSAFYIIRSAPLLGKRRAAALALGAIAPIITMYIQYRYPYIIIDMLGISMSLLYIVAYVDNPGGKLESDSQLMRYQAYVNDLRMAFFTLENIDIIQIDIENHRELEKMLSYSNYTGFVKTIGELLRDINASGRYDGSLYNLKNGKFRVILHSSQFEDTIRMAEEIRDAFNGEIYVNDMALSVEATVFVSQCPTDFSFMDEIMAFGRVAYSYSKPGEIVLIRDILNSDEYKLRGDANQMIENGILNKSFEVYYQPVFDVRSGSYSAAEALLRLNDDKGNIIESEKFIEAAEKSGLIRELGKIVLKEACEFISSEEFRNSGLEVISLNLSAVQCIQNNLTDYILHEIDKYGISKKQIIFEIKESLASDRESVFSKNIKELEDAGLSFAIDNFGMGYSNITTLSTLPILGVKLDRNFISVGDNKKHKDILESTIEMCRAVNKIIIAVGIENEEMAKQFIDYGCTFLQGFYYARPMKREELVNFLDRQENKVVER